jgi:hypothetical protein
MLQACRECNAAGMSGVQCCRHVGSAMLQACRECNAAGMPGVQCCRRVGSANASGYYSLWVWSLTCTMLVHTCAGMENLEYIATYSARVMISQQENSTIGTSVY